MRKRSCGTVNTDDGFWERLHNNFSEPEVVELGGMIGLTLASGQNAQGSTVAI